MGMDDAKISIESENDPLEENAKKLSRHVWGIRMQGYRITRDHTIREYPRMTQQQVMVVTKSRRKTRVDFHKSACCSTFRDGHVCVLDHSFPPTKDNDRNAIIRHFSIMWLAVTFPLFVFTPECFDSWIQIASKWSRETLRFNMDLRERVEHSFARWFHLFKEWLVTMDIWLFLRRIRACTSRQYLLQRWMHWSFERRLIMGLPLKNTWESCF